MCAESGPDNRGIVPVDFDWGQRPESDIPDAVPRALRRAMPPQEVRVWSRLRKLRAQGHSFRRQVPIGNYVVDFACLRRRLIVELDGGHHGSDEHRRRDQLRDEALGALGFHVIRFWNSAVREDIDSVMDTIHAALVER